MLLILCLHREYVHSVAVYKKYLTRLGELIISEPWRENYHFSQPRYIFFDKRQHYVRILFIFQRLICCVLLCLTPTDMNLAVKRDPMTGRNQGP